MTFVDLAAATRFLRTAYDAGDWVALFLKTYRTGDIVHRVMPLSAATRPQCLKWLQRVNAHGWNVYVSVNAIRPGRSRTRESIAAVRHVFLEVDADGPGLLASLTTRRDLPPPSYVLHSSSERLHVFWRARGFVCSSVEQLQKRLARELQTDAAATSCAQMTRLPGFMNHKYARPWPVFVENLRPGTVFTTEDFPEPVEASRTARPSGHNRAIAAAKADRVDRARRYLAAVPPAVAGAHGDLRTFRVCCRVVRGFDLADDEAVAVLREWNDRCEPPWSERELLKKIRNARRYGRERIGGLLANEAATKTHAYARIRL